VTPRQAAGSKRRKTPPSAAQGGASEVEREPAARGKRSSAALYGLAAALLPLLFFWHTTRFGFLLDDFVLYQSSPSLAEPGSVAAGFHLDVEINFETPIIGRQRMAHEMTPGIFRNEICRARTFGFMSDVERLWKAGLALGANLTNTIAIGEDKVINREGLRYNQEFVRHKMLDAVGDLALAGAPLLCAFRSVRGGHRLNANVLQALFADATAWSWVQAPGVREPMVREAGYALAAGK
jgi:hypothetical protein